MAKEKPYATCHKQESRHTKILGNAFSEYSILVQFEARFNKDDCNFIKQDQMQIFSTTHSLQSSLRKRYA